MAVTLEDIAKKAGVTKAVVSQILREHPDAVRFREETRQRVRQVAQELNYRPNFFASQIRASNRRLAMLCIKTFTDLYAGEVATAFEQALADRGYHAIVTAFNTQKNEELRDGILGPHGILGLAVVGYASGLWMDDERLDRLAAEGVSVVAIGRPVASDRVSRVVYDNDAGVIGAVDCLLQQGARRFWMVGEDHSPSSHFAVLRNRVRLAAEHATARGAESVRTLAVGPHSPETGEQAILQALKDGARPDGVFCGGDLWALGTLRAFAQAGIRVGEEVAVIGFNDNQFAAYTNPSLTTVRIPAPDLGREGGALVVDMLEGSRPAGTMVCRPTELMLRESHRLR